MKPLLDAFWRAGAYCLHPKVIGLSLLKGGAVSTVTVAAIFLSNIPKGLSSAAGMAGAPPGVTTGCRER